MKLHHFVTSPRSQFRSTRSKPIIHRANAPVNIYIYKKENTEKKGFKCTKTVHTIHRNKKKIKVITILITAIKMSVSKPCSLVDNATELKAVKKTLPDTLKHQNKTAGGKSIYYLTH